jgi:hypothetical protein
MQCIGAFKNKNSLFSGFKTFIALFELILIEILLIWTVLNIEILVLEDLFCEHFIS